MSATDPDGDNIRYGVDWNADHRGPVGTYDWLRADTTSSSVGT
jgi:hypothetical protein